MKTYYISVPVTEVKMKNIYLVEASSIDEAIEKVKNGGGEFSNGVVYGEKEVLENCYYEDSENN